MIYEDTPTKEIFDYYRKHGYPNYDRADYSPAFELQKVRSAPDSDFFVGDVFRKYPSANGFLFSYFPHWIDVKCGSSLSLRDCWNDDKKLWELIEKTKRFCVVHHENWSTNRLRQNAKVYCAKQSVSNFNPVTARILYDAFAPQGVVYDMSMGWGGRLLGFYASIAKTYIGCEPSTKTYAGLRELNADLGKFRVRNTDLYMEGSETVDLSGWYGKVDFAFTSPPYFDTERYCDEPTQSYIAYPTMSLWLEHFIKPTFQTVHEALRPSGVMAINYADNKRVTEAISSIARSIGFTQEETFRYELSSVNGKGAKFEPIMTFRKGGDGLKRYLSMPSLFD